MQEIGNKIKNFPDTIIDESFFHRERNDFDLFIYFDQEKLSFSAWSSEDHTLSAFEPQPLHSFKDLSDPIVLRDLFHNSALGKETSGYNRRVLFSGLRNVTMIPNALFNPDELRLQHSFSVPSVGDQAREYSDELRIADARSIYTIPEEIEMNLHRLIGEHDLFHSSTAFIETQLLKNRNRNEQICSLIIHSNYFEILVIGGRQLILYNTFDIENPESVLYYVLFCCEQLELNPESIMLEIAGAIDNTSAIYQGLENYFSNISFREGPGEVKMSYRFQDSMPHLYFPALNFPVCV